MKETVRCALAFACDVRWEELSPTEDAAARHCGRCQKLVHAVSDEAAFVARAMVGDCVAFRPAEVGVDLPPGHQRPRHEPPPPEVMLAGMPVRPDFGPRFPDLAPPPPPTSWWRRLLGWT